MSLFTAPLRIVCTEEEWDVLHRPIVNGGGLQLLLRRVLEGTVSDKDRTLSVEEADLDEAYRLAYAHGSGGYQDRMKVLIKAALRAGWSPV